MSNALFDVACHECGYDGPHTVMSVTREALSLGANVNEPWEHEVGGLATVTAECGSCYAEFEVTE